MIRTLDEYEVASVATTIPFCRFAMELEDAERYELTVLAPTLYYRRTQEKEAPTIA